MINITKDTQFPTVSNVIGILNSYNQLMPVLLDFDKIHQYISWFSLEIDNIGKPLFETLKGVRGRDTVSSLLTIWLKQRGEDISVFNRTKTGFSLDKDSIKKAIESGRLSEEAVTVLGLAQTYNNYVKTRKTLISFLQFPVIGAKSFDGHRMIAVRPKWRGQNTNRVAMYEPAFQNLNREMQDIFTCPEGWIRIHCDSGQIEPRTIYSSYLPDPQIQALINLYGDAYFGILHYCTMPLSHIADKRLTFEKMDTEKYKKDRQLIKTYGNAVMYGSTSNPGKDPIKQAMIDRIGKHPIRLQWIEQCKEQIERGNYIFKTYFGTPIDISKSDKLVNYEYATQEDLNYELLKLAINNPIQGTAADLMRLSVVEAYKLLSREGKDSVISMYIHDAGVFHVHENDYDKIGDRLKDIVAYNVEGWIPIKADSKVGRDDGLFPDLY